MSSFNVVISTIGRPTLKRMIRSFAHDLSSEDILTIIWDGTEPDRNLVDGLKCKVIFFRSNKRLGNYGHAARTYFQKFLSGDYIMNADDDDIYLPGAMDKIKQHCVDKKLYIFKMLWNEKFIPYEAGVMEVGNIGTPCGVYPNIKDFPEWGSLREGDFEFYNKLSQMLEPVWVDEAIYKIRPR